MYCKACGKEIEGDSAFCRYCGTTQISALSPADPVQSPPAPAATETPAPVQPTSIGPLIAVGALVVGVLLVIAIFTGSNGTKQPATGGGLISNDVSALENMADALDASTDARLDDPVADTSKPSDPWSYSNDEDKVRGGTSYYATASSTNSIYQDAPYGEAQLRMTVRRSPRSGTDVIIVLTSGQLLCPSYEGCSGTVRFDDGPAQRISFSGAADNSSDTIFVNGASGFIAKLKRAKKLIVEVNIYQAGQPQFEFDVHGLKWDH